MKKLWFFLILFKMFLLVLLTSCQSTVPFIKKTIVYAQVPRDYYVQEADK